MKNLILFTFLFCGVGHAQSSPPQTSPLHSTAEGSAQWTLSKSFKKFLPAAIKYLLLTPDNSKLIAVGDEGEVKILDLKTLKTVESTALSTQRRYLRQVLLTPDGKKLIAAGGDLKILNLETMQQIPVPDQGTFYANYVASTHDSSALLEVGPTGKIRRLDLMTMKEVEFAQIPQTTVNLVQVSLSPDDSSAIVCDVVNDCSILDMETKKVSWLGGSDCIDKTPYSVGFSKNGNLLAWTWGDVNRYGPSQVWLYDVRSNYKNLLNYNVMDGVVRQAFFTPNDKMLVTVGAEKIDFVDLQTMKQLDPIYYFNDSSSTHIEHAAVTPDGSTLVVGTVWGEIFFSNLQTMRNELSPVKMETIVSYTLVSSDGSTIFVSDLDGNLKILHKTKAY